MADTKGGTPPPPSPQPNWPSKEPGKPSGPGRDNNPPRPKKT
jgi:hypothetical protein